jgi:hypothetical protein
LFLLLLHEQVGFFGQFPQMLFKDFQGFFQFWSFLVCHAELFEVGTEAIVSCLEFRTLFRKVFGHETHLFFHSVHAGVDL